MAVKAVAKYSQTKEEVYFVKGAIEMVLPQCTKYWYGGRAVSLTKQNEVEFLQEAYEIGRKGLRVLALARGTSFQDLVFLGIVGITGEIIENLFK